MLSFKCKIEEKKVNKKRNLLLDIKKILLKYKAPY